MHCVINKFFIFANVELYALIMIHSKTERKFLEFFEENYSKCFGYVSSYVDDKGKVKQIITGVMKSLWDGRVSGQIHSFDIPILVSMLDEEINNTINTYKRSGYSLQYCDSVLTALPKKRRMVFEMSRHEGLSRSEIATKLGISKRTVDKHLELAVRQLKNES